MIPSICDLAERMFVIPNTKNQRGLGVSHDASDASVYSQGGFKCTMRV